MRDTSFNDTHKIELADTLLTDMQRQLGRRESPAFERFRDYLRAPSGLSARITAEIVEMLRAQCFAHSQSYRQSRGAALWAELHWLNEELLIATYDKLWSPQYYPWKASVLVRHANAGPALWMHVLSGPVHVITVFEISTESTLRGYHEFVEQLGKSTALVSIATDAA